MAEDHGLTKELAEAHVREGLERWWQQARRRGTRAAAARRGGQTSEEIARLRQLDFVRQTARRGQSPGSPRSEDGF